MNSKNLIILRELRELLKKCAATSMCSKLIAYNKDFFSDMVVDAVMCLDSLLPLNMIGTDFLQIILGTKIKSMQTLASIT